MSEKSKYLLLLVVCIALSLGGIVAALFTKEPLDGSRGGVLAVGLAVAYLVVRKDVAGEVFDTLEEHAREESPTADPGVKADRLVRRFDDLKASLRSKGEDERSLSWYLATATIIGTLAAAFGDIAAKCLIARFPN
jgi:hypothetical protein